MRDPKLECECGHMRMFHLPPKEGEDHGGCMMPRCGCDAFRLQRPTDDAHSRRDDE